MCHAIVIQTKVIGHPEKDHIALMDNNYETQEVKRPVLGISIKHGHTSDGVVDCAKV